MVCAYGYKLAIDTTEVDFEKYICEEIVDNDNNSIC